MRDVDKRNRILASAKTLFAEQGFAGTSISDIAAATAVPVGSIYTYFENKDALLRVIVEEGWAEFYSRLSELAAGEREPEDKLRALVTEFLPGLVRDVDLINILLSEGITLTRLQEKLERLSSVVLSMTEPLLDRRAGAPKFEPTEFQAALMVYFLGVLHASRISRVANLAVTPGHITGFLKRSIESALGVRI
jgi:AcrR family transcriptional regulator